MTKRTLFLFVLFSSGIFAVFSQAVAAPPGQAPVAEQPSQAKADLTDLSLEQLLNVKISVASKKETTTRESPGIVTLITHEDIRKSGARDLIDVLNLVPGFFFGTDVTGVVGVGIRGNWAHEGKALMVVDGQEMNEALFGTLQFGNHFPVEHIERIEIIRGPGSAIYGGFAELAVINITTRGAESLDGLESSLAYGQGKDVFGRRNLNLQYGKKYGDWRFSSAAFVGQGNRSDRPYTDSAGNSYSMTGDSRLTPLWLNLGLGYKTLDLRFIADRYGVTGRDAYDQSLNRPVDTSFETYAFGAKYNHKFTEAVVGTAEFNYRSQIPWKAVGTVAEEEQARLEINSLVYDTTTRRTKGLLSLSYDIVRELNFMVGLEMYQDRATRNLEGQVFSTNGEKEISYLNKAGFAQATLTHPVANVTIGARYDFNNQFGSEFVPRFAVTKVVGDFHAKAIYAEGFRAPNIENIDLNPDIRAEKTQDKEIEVGYRLTENLLVSANVFDTQIRNPIVYQYDDDTGQEDYLNYDRTGTWGFEIENQFRGKFGQVTGGYSYYRAKTETVDSYEVDGDDSQHLAFPTHKFTLRSSIYLGRRDLSLNPSVVYLGNRYGIGFENDVHDQQKFDPTWLVDLYLLQDNLFMKGLSVGAGVFNLLDQNYRFIQPYRQGHNPIPSFSREYLFRVTYQIGL